MEPVSGKDVVDVVGYFVTSVSVEDVGLLIMINLNFVLRFESLNIWEFLYAQVKVSSQPKFYVAGSC